MRGVVTTEQPNETDSVRRRDAVRTREALLQAAKDLFGAKGYAGTTLRQIGERAGVDAALVARYFGSKTAIYIASLDTEGPDATAAAPLTLEFIDRMIGRITSVGPSPLQQAVVLRTADDEVRDATRRIIDARITQPLLQEMARRRLDHPNLRAEIAFAALTGIVLARSAGTFETLAEAGHDDVVELTLRTVRAILDV